MVVLNGTSSAGKSTLAGVFVQRRAALGECWILVGIDDANAKLPWQWFDSGTAGGGGVHGPFAAEGLRFVPGHGGLVVSVGPLGGRLYAAYRRGVAAWANCGFDVIVDEVCFDQASARDWEAALAGLDVTWVAVRTSPEVAEARERARGDRIPGLARGISAVVHEHVRYDLELDADEADPAELAGRLERFLSR